GNASTQLLDGMHYRGMVRIARREGGVRLYAAREDHAAAPDAAAAFDALIDVVVHKYAPLPAASLGQLVSHLIGGAPQWHADRNAALKRAKARLASARVDGIEWFWPAAENPASKRHASDDAVRLLAPFDPVVWDRRRFEHFWDWAYRFEAYTPAPKRVRGYYALPLLWRDQVIGWGNLSVANGVLVSDIGYQSGRAPRDAAFRAALADELQRLRAFLKLAD
ncbi:MAG: crosslink repair DNA glycosylase YcaQ family protein, partial [Burkholderiales bacterium]